MPTRWRLPLLLSACVVLGQLLSLNPLLDVVAGAPPDGVRLAYTIGHVLLAPLTLLADWLNGGPARELKGFAVWLVAVFVFVRLARFGGRASEGAPRSGWPFALREVRAVVLAVAALALYVAWGALAPRPIPRLATDDPDLLIFDIHSHTAGSHDGRAGFGVTANAAWHSRAGFGAAFVTDHNTTAWIRAAASTAPPGSSVPLPGIELSLSGLHLLALGNRAEIPNAPYRGSWDATGQLIRALASGQPTGTAPFLVASLPEYWQHHWGADLGTLVQWGVRGFEIWTSSPRAMDFPEPRRREVIARSRLDGLAMFAATDMHGFGYSATAWNVTRIAGWQQLDAEELGRVLTTKFRREGPDANRVVVLRRWIPETPLQVVAAVPLNLVLLLRTASPAHAASLFGWIWAVALLSGLRSRPRRS